MAEKTLKTLLSKVKIKSLIGSPAVPIADLTNDSRRVRPGSVFIAVPGYSLDGHRFIRDAVEAGASAVIAQYPTENISVPQVLVENVRATQAAMAAEFFEHPSKALKIIGVTGTNGKTTSTFMIESILRAATLRTGLVGTLYNMSDGKIMPTINTTPDSIVFQRLLREMVDNGVSHVSMEVSSHAMVMHRVDQTLFRAGAITNFSPDHLDLHRDMEDYLLAKKRFFDILPTDSFAIVNMDNPDCRRIAETTRARAIYYSLTNPDADVFLVFSQIRGTGTVVNVRIKSELHTSELYYYLGVRGRHNIANSLLAASTCLAMGIDPACIAKGLGAFRGIFRRCEVIYNGRFKVIDDATHNPANMEAVFRAVYAEKPARISVVYAIRGNRGVKINRSIADTLSFWAQRINPVRLVITNCSDTSSQLDRVKPEEEEIFQSALADLNLDIHFTDTLRQAVSTALETVKQGDLLLLMGAHPMDNVSDLFAELAGVEITTLPRPPRFGVH